ncbi:alpha/beta fold hydrolase [Acrocarpospora sp. B8E8]|uniref:alpha/beta fold hydrolase n=1 Tax=Acrocarpospora sp. B8E8 TaxID=3153572 RepID=UPI00325C8D6F
MSPLLLLHPLGADGRFWDDVLPHLDGIETVAPDLPGHGAAPCLPAGAGIGDFADAVAGERAHVVGLSLGGLIAQELAAGRPDLVDRLVLVGTVAVYPEPMREMWRHRARVAREGALAELAEPMADMWFTEPFRPTPARIRERFLAMDPEGYARACEALESADTTRLAPAISSPTLIACGSADLPPFIQAAHWLHEHIAASELTWLTGKHAAALERPAEFAAALRSFLAR